MGTLRITGDDEADRLLDTDGLALLIGMLLDQQVPMEWAFRGPGVIRARIGHLDPVRLAAMPVDDLVAVCCGPPAIHRFPAAMARRIHALSETIVAEYGGDPASIWTTARDGEELGRRLRALPGFGIEKSMIFTALLAKRFDVRPPGWERAAGPFSDDTPRSAADVDGPEALRTVREWKRRQRALGRSKQQ